MSKAPVLRNTLKSVMVRGSTYQVAIDGNQAVWLCEYKLVSGVHTLVPAFGPVSDRHKRDGSLIPSECPFVAAAQQYLPVPKTIKGAA